MFLKSYFFYRSYSLLFVFTNGGRATKPRTGFRRLPLAESDARVPRERICQGANLPPVKPGLYGE